jgi:hypothetical protein
MLPNGFNPDRDFRAHGERVRRMLAEWRLSQGNRAANGHVEIMHALEYMAEPYANVACWADNPEPLRLSRGQVRICQQRAISQERRRQHGALPRDGAAWWEQISAIAAAWGIETAYEEWAAKREAASSGVSSKVEVELNNASL